MLKTVVAAALVGAAMGDKWKPVTDGVDTWSKLNYNTNFGVNVGDATGTKMVYMTGTTTMHNRMAGASASKWPSASMISGLVNDGILSYDDKPSKYLSWWATDPSDSRSNITLRHLLSFTDGYVKDGQVNCSVNPSYDFVDCQRQLYEVTPHAYPPGVTWAYLECHYQFAGAMAVAASGIPIDQLYAKYLYTPLKLNATTWGSPPYKNPQIAAGITTTGNDYEKFLFGTLTNKFLPQDITNVLETDWSKPPISPSGMFFGHYCMGNFFECYGYTIGRNQSEPQYLPQRCIDEKIHSDPGLWGWFPILDRSREFYYQVVVKENYIKSGIPEYYTMLAKPLINYIMVDKDPAQVNREVILEDMGGMILRDIFGIDEASRIIPSRENKKLSHTPELERFYLKHGMTVEADPIIGGWDTLWAGLNAWHGQEFTKHFAFHVGNTSGTQYTTSFGRLHMGAKVQGGSVGKWPVAAMVAMHVESGALGFDDLVKNHLSWWAQDSSDSRSQITLRHLLTSTSGFQSDVNVTCQQNPGAIFMDCVKDLYTATPKGAAPGTEFTNLDCHMEFAGAVLEAATKRPINELLTEFTTKVGMTQTQWGAAPYNNPSLARGMQTTGEDYGKFLEGMLGYKFLSKATVDQMEMDATAGKTPAGDGWQGHYGMGHFVECFGYATPGGAGAALTQNCVDSPIHAISGEHGYYALYDRPRNMYMQVVVEEPQQTAGIPQYMRIVAKPVVDGILLGHNAHTINRYDLFIAKPTGGAILLRELIYIQKARDNEL